MSPCHQEGRAHPICQDLYRPHPIPLRSFLSYTPPVSIKSCFPSFFVKFVSLRWTAVPLTLFRPFLLCFHLVQGSGFKVQGSGGGFAAFFIGRCPKVVFKSRVTSHNNDTSRPLETEVPQRDFRVWPNPKRRLACPLRRLPVRPNGPRRRRRMDPRSGVKNYVRLPVSLKRHPDRSGGILFADR